MAKIQIKSEKLTPFGGIFHVMDLFERHLSHIIDGTLGKRSVSIGYDYSEIIRSLMCVYFCGGSCVEDNSFGWNRLPKSFMNENTVFLLILVVTYSYHTKSRRMPHGACL